MSIKSGTVKTDNKVLIKMSFEASFESAPYIEEKTAAFAATGIAVINTGIPSTCPFKPTKERIINTTKGVMINLKKTII